MLVLHRPIEPTVKSGEDQQRGFAAHVRFAPKADKQQIVSAGPLSPKADSCTAAYNPRAPGFIRSHRRRSRAGGDSSRLCRHPMSLAAAIPTAMGETRPGACRKAAALV